MNYFTGISAVAAAVRLARAPAWRDKTIMVISPDSGGAIVFTTQFHDTFQLDRMIEICQN